MGKIGEGDSLVPAVQISDINDGDIINGTQQEVDPQGRARFHYTMPDGSPISSDWVMPDFIKQARRQWVEAVKQNIVAQSQSAQDAAIRAGRARQLEESILDIPEVTERILADVPAARGSRTESVSADPSDHAKACLVKATEEAQYWAEEELKAAQKKQSAEKAGERWAKVLSVLNAD